MRTICEGTEHTRSLTKTRPIKGKCCIVVFELCMFHLESGGLFVPHNGFGSRCTFLKQVLDSDGLLRVNQVRRQEPILETDGSALWLKNWSKNEVTLLYECGSLCFDRDAYVNTEVRHDSLHPLDQWLGFGQQPSPLIPKPTHTNFLKRPSAQNFTHNLWREFNFCKCNTSLSKDPSLGCCVWQRSHRSGPSFPKRTRHVCPPSLEIAPFTVGALVLHHRCLITKKGDGEHLGSSQCKAFRRGSNLI